MKFPMVKNGLTLNLMTSPFSGKPFPFQHNRGSQIFMIMQVLACPAWKAHLINLHKIKQSNKAAVPLPSNSPGVFALPMKGRITENLMNSFTPIS
ncbi:hypothetical protein UP17_22870 [Peribacillus simplex]|nr:hypothetical protein UP17_22870 [Peribacillus simplex]